MDGRPDSDARYRLMQVGTNEPGVGGRLGEESTMHRLLKVGLLLFAATVVTRLAA